MSEKGKSMGIFNRVKEVITVDISEKISYGNSIRKLSGEINSNETTIRSLINQVGVRCVENHINETDSEYGDLFSKILELRESNQKLSEEIQRLKEQQAEEERQRQQMREEMQLAKQQKIYEQQTQATPSVSPTVSPTETAVGKFCKKCGKPNDVDSSFCVHCGNPFVTETTEEPEVKEETDVL